ncbi:MAG: CDP-alcohol phosphatidyltransferase family protein [Acidobacteriota bacterium]
MKSSQNFVTNSEYLKASKRHGHPLINRYVKVNAWINRPLAWPIVKTLKPTKITPNQVSVASFLIGIGGAVCFAMGSPFWFIAGGILAQLSSIVDCADGMLARAKNIETVFGRYLDIFLDRLVEFFLIGSVGLGLFKYTGQSLFLIIALLGSAAYFLHVSLYYITIHYFHNKVRGDTSESRAVLLILMLFFSVINRLDIAIWFFLAVGVFTNVYIVIDFIRSQNKKPLS